MRRCRTILYAAFLCVIGAGYYLFVYNPVLPSRMKRTACDLLAVGDPLDTSIVVNPHSFVNTIIPPSDCEVGVYLVVYVHTSRGHHGRRATIRRTWGNVSQYDVRVRVLFVVGLGPSDEVLSKESKELNEEGQKYGDVLP